MKLKPVLLFLTALTMSILFFSIPAQIWAATKQIVIVRYRIEPLHFQELVDQFKNTMAQRGYQEGADVEYVDILTSTADERSVPEVIDAINHYKDTADMFITCGWISLHARQILKHTKKPQIFAPVLESVGKELLPSLTCAPGTNLSGIYLMYPPEKILKITRFLLPNLTRYAYVYDSRIPADASFKKAYEALDPFAKYGINVTFIDLKDGIHTVKQQLIEKKIEAFGGIVGAFQHRDELADTNLPIITAFTLDIPRADLPQYLKEGNVLAGLFNPFGQCGEAVAQMTSDIFDKKNTIDKIVPQPAKQVAFINLKAAKKLGVHVSFEALDSVDFVLQGE